MAKKKFMSRLSRGLILIQLAVWILLLAGCESKPLPVQIYFDPRSENLPFPSDLVHLDYSSENTRPLLPRLSPEQKVKFNQITPDLEHELADLHGFSPSGPIIVQFSDWIDLSSLPPTPESSLRDGSSVFLLNFDPDHGHLGKRYLFRWKFDWENNALVIQPRTPLEPGEIHLLVITDQLKDTNGNAVQSSSFFRLMKVDYILNIEYLEALRGKYSKIFTDIYQILGISKESICLAVEFTIEASIQDPLQVLINDTRRRPLPLIESIEPENASSENLSYHGEILLPYYLDWKGKLILHDPRSGRYPGLLPGYRVDFKLTFPVPATITLPGNLTASVSPPFPLVIVQPGLFDPGSSLSNLVQALNENGIATLLLQSTFPAPEAFYPRDVSNPAFPWWRKIPGLNLENQYFDLLQFRDYFLQTAASLSLLIQSIPELSELDLYPRGPTSTGDGIPDLDLTRVGFFGDTSGTIPGLLSLSRQTEVLTAVFRRPGGGWPEIFFDTPLWSSGLTAYLQQKGFSLLDLSLFQALIGPLLDPADAINFFPSFQSEETGGAGLHNVLFQVLIPDPLVPNSSSFNLARAYGIPLLLPSLPSEEGSGTQPSPVEGNIQGSFSGGLFEFPGTGFDPGDAESIKADLQAAQFFSSYFYSGQAVIINPESQ